MKKSFNILMILCAVAFILSCNNTKSYTDYLKDERKQINHLFDANDFVKLKDYPESGVFKDKEYVELQNGVWFHVIDSGNGNRPTSGTVILSRAKGMILDGDSVTFDGFKSSDNSTYWPLEFKYGGTSDANGDAYFMSQGYASVMDFVGDSSYVSMIVPFRVGSSYQQNSYCAIYYEKVRFVFQK